MTLDLAAAGADDFEPHLESPFESTAPTGESRTLVLVDVKRGTIGPAREQFTLTFTGGTDPPTPQGIVHLEHDVLGGLDLFLVPVGPGGDGRQLYEAVFA